MGIGSCVVAAGVFVFASRLRTDSLPERFCRAVRWLSDRTFGIYLIHVFFVTLFFRILKINIFAFFPLLTVIGSAIVIFVLSAVVARLFSLIHGLKRLV